MLARSPQLCPTFCDPMDRSPPGSSVHRILQARLPKWVAMSSFRDLPDPGIKLMSLMSPALYVGMYVCVCMCVCVCVQMSAVVSYWLEMDICSEGRLLRFDGGYILPDSGGDLILVSNSLVSHLCHF